MKYILGHKNPDTDSVCSAIAYQNFLHQVGVESKVVVLGELNKETKFVLDYFGVTVPEKVKELPKDSKVVLVDHNEKEQSIDNLDELEIVGILDHHKIKMQTDKPIYIHVEPVGSSCSIVAKKFFAKKVEMSREIAGILMAGIISDTLFFRSPTTTEKDRELVEKLNTIVKMGDLEAFSLQMFDAKSDVRDLSTEEIIKLDYKVFEFGGEKYGIGVMETTNKDFGLERKDEVAEKLAEMKSQNGLKAVFLSVIDILKKESWTICSDMEASELFKKMFKAEEKDGVLFVPNLVSRKKEIVPVFERELNV